MAECGQRQGFASELTISVERRTPHFIMLSKSCIYALRAAIYIALQEEDEQHVSIRKIADELGISFHFLTKILQQLTEAGLLLSLRGPAGGVRLARPAKSITLLDIVLVIEGERFFSACLLGLPGCGIQAPCPVHEEWASTRKRLIRMFERSSLAKLAQEARSGNIRITDQFKARHRHRA